MASLVFGSALLCGARKQLVSAVSEHEPGTVWTIMMSDESKVAQVGVALKSLDGMKGADLVTQDQAFKNLAADPSLRPQLQALKTNPFHSYFQVTWDLQQFKPQTLESQAQAIRHWPGVGTVVSHPTQIKVAHELRGSLAEISSGLLGGLFGLTAFSLLWVGFNIPELHLDMKTVLKFVLWDGAFGAVGFILAGLFLNFQFPWLLALGFLAGLVRAVGTCGKSTQPQEAPQDGPLQPLQSETP